MLCEAKRQCSTQATCHNTQHVRPQVSPPMHVGHPTKHGCQRKGQGPILIGVGGRVTSTTPLITHIHTSSKACINGRGGDLRCCVKRNDSAAPKPHATTHSMSGPRSPLPCMWVTLLSMGVRGRVRAPYCQLGFHRLNSRWTKPL